MAEKQIKIFSRSDKELIDGLIAIATDCDCLDDAPTRIYLGSSGRTIDAQLAELHKQAAVIQMIAQSGNLIYRILVTFRVLNGMTIQVTREARYDLVVLSYQ